MEYVIIHGTQTYDSSNGMYETCMNGKYIILPE